MTSTSLFPRPKRQPSQATIQAEGIADMTLVLHKASGRNFYYCEDGTSNRISAAVHVTQGKEEFALTIRTSTLEPSKTPGKNNLAPIAAIDYPIKGIKAYHAETAMHLGLNPAHLVTKPESVGEYLQGLNADNTMLYMYEDLGLAPEDAAKAIRMQQQMADSGQGDAEASTDYLADMSGYDFTMALDDDNTLAAGQDFTR